MRTYYAKFIGHYPVGACAVIVAESRNRAFRLLRERLGSEMLLLKNEDLTPSDLVFVSSETPGVKFFMNGDY